MIFKNGFNYILMNVANYILMNVATAPWTVATIPICGVSCNIWNNTILQKLNE